MYACSKSYTCALDSLLQIAIHTPEEAKVGVKNHVYCCPICVYVVQNDLIFLTHIIVGHYWGSFSCGKCLAFVAVTTQQMKRHIAGCGKPQMEHSKARSTHSRAPEAHISSRPSHRSRKAKKRTDKEGVGAWQHGRDHAVHQQSPFRQSPPRSRLPTLRATDTLRVPCTCARQPPSLVTPGRLRSTRSQCPECLLYVHQQCLVRHNVRMHRAHVS